MEIPAIIDPTIEVRIYSHAMQIPPHIVEDFDQDKEKAKELEALAVEHGLTIEKKEQ